MILSSKTDYIFIPLFNGNRGLSPADQVSVEIIRPKAEERTELFSMDIERNIHSEDIGEKAASKTALTFKRRYDVSRILRRHIGKITNLKDQKDDDTIVPVLDGPALAESTMFGIGSLIDELCVEVIKDTIPDNEKKISKEPLK